MNIVISGGARGIGKAIAEKFAAEGHHIFITARNGERLKKTAEELQQKFPSSTIDFSAADLSEKEGCYLFADWCLSKAVPDILINNAGSYKPGNVSNEEDGNLESMLGNNLYSAYYLTKRFLPQMMKKKKGHIFNICSVASLNAYAGGGSYSISKFAMNGFSKNLRLEMIPHHIKVTAVFPGAVLTDSWGDFDNSEQRIMVAADVADMILTASKLSAGAVPEEIILRPQLGDL